MSEYRPPLDDIRFLLTQVIDLEGLSKLGRVRACRVDAVFGVLEEFGRLMSEVWSPTNAIGDQEGSQRGRRHGRHAGRASRSRTTNTSWPDGARCPFDEAYGGGGFPWLVGIAMQEMLNSANMALAMAPLLTQGAIDALLHHGSEAQRERYLTEDGHRRVDRHHEPHRARRRLRRRCVAHPGGPPATTAPTASPARRSSSRSASTTSPTTSSTSCWPAPPTRRPARRASPASSCRSSCSRRGRGPASATTSMSCRSSTRWASRAVPPVSSPTATDGDGAIGELIGDENAGMRYMFTMMNNARLGVGVEGLGVARAGLPAGLASTPQERQSGPCSGRSGGEKLAHHRPPRRAADAADDEGVDRGDARPLPTWSPSSSTWPGMRPTTPPATDAQELADLLIPLAKSWCTDVGRDGDVDRHPGPRRHGLHRGDGCDAVLPRRQDHPDLRGHQRHPGDGPRRPQASVARWRRATGIRSPACGPRAGGSAGAGETLAVIHTSSCCPRLRSSRHGVDVRARPGRPRRGAVGGRRPTSGCSP